MTEHRRLVGRRSAVLAGLVALVSSLVTWVAVPAAHAATRTVTLTANGPSPARLVLAAGDRVRFVNGDGVDHRVTSGRGWSYDSGDLVPGATSAPTPALSTAGTYTYTDTRQLLLTVARFTGSLVVPAAPKPSRSPSSAPRPSRSASPPAAPQPLPTDVLPTQPPGVPTGFPTAGAVPSPSPVAPAPVVPGTSPSPSQSPDVRYGDPAALAQHSPHRYGLPALLGLVAIGGVASLLLRFLLSLAPGSRRTDD